MHISIHRMYIHITYMKEMSYIYIDACIQNPRNYDLLSTIVVACYLL